MLKDTQAPSSITKLVTFMLKTSVANVFFNGVNEGQWPIGNGARQGGILSLLLFNFYTNVLLKE